MTTLILRRTWPDDDRPHKPDYLAYEGEIKIGRIYLSVSTHSGLWFWTINCYHPSEAANQGHEPDLEAAKRALKDRWLSIRDHVMTGPVIRHWEAPR